MHSLAETDPTRSLRCGVYTVMIAAAAGLMLGRIVAVNSVDNIRLERRLNSEAARDGKPPRELERPFLSGNDRSRWGLVRALVEHGTYSIDDIVCQTNWDTIDMVKHQDAEGVWRLYSSKPPLFPTLLAGPYWGVHRATGWTLGDHPFEIGRALLVLVNLLPLVLHFALIAGIAERIGRTDFGKILVVGAASAVTLLTTFATVLNNHVTAAVSVTVALYATVRIVWDDEQRPKWYLLAGLAGAFAAANELPALLVPVLVGLGLLVQNPRLTAAAYLPGLLLVAAAFFGTNYLAHQTLIPPYMHRSQGEVLFSYEAGDEAVERLNSGEIGPALTAAFELASLELSENAVVESRQIGDVKAWTVNDVVDRRGEKYRLLRRGDQIDVHAWDDWYDYNYECNGRVRASYWRNPDAQSRVDRGEPNRGVYALHLLIGHHGVFSLTPFWLLFPIGAVALGFRQERRGAATALGLGVLLASVVCIAFYISRPVFDRNYGGTSAAARWLLWFTPLWLAVSLPAADWLGRRRVGRAVAAALLVASGISVAYPVWNPWTHPWLADFLAYLGAIEPF